MANKKEMIKSHTLRRDVLKEADYEVDDTFRSGRTIDDVHTTAELIAELKKNPKVEIDARVLAVNPKTMEKRVVQLNRDQFLEHVKKNGNKKFKEAFDAFLSDTDVSQGLIGDDFVPLLGGPFYKQLYPRDYIRMHGLSFQAYHHDPIAKHTCQMMRDFTMGRGFRVDIPQSPIHLAHWRAFEEANDFANFMDQFALELSIYGEQMVWFLPNLQSKITYQLKPSQTIPKGLIPRIRLIDPSVMWEIVTYPEDMTRVLFYQWIAPTQYQSYSGRDEGASVGTSKFIFQQIPGDQIIHVKVNAVSNEKRGRSDLFPVLGYLKRLRDTINYSIVALQKTAAWAIDTTIEGSQTDINAYIADQQSQGTVAPAGSEFVHTSKITRQYQANQASGSKSTPTFDWTLSMIAAGTGFPISYYNTHLSGGSTRASAIVSTEPIAKKLEMRQLVYERTVKKIAAKYFDMIGLPPIDIEVTFPEIITQDRSEKLKDISLAEAMKWISHERAANMVAKELNVTDFDFDTEIQKIEAESPAEQVVPTTTNPLTAPGIPFADQPAKPDSPSAVTSADKKALNDAR